MIKQGSKLTFFFHTVTALYLAEVVFFVSINAWPSPLQLRHSFYQSKSLKQYGAQLTWKDVVETKCELSCDHFPMIFCVIDGVSIILGPKVTFQLATSSKKNKLSALFLVALATSELQFRALSSHAWLPIRNLTSVI